MKILYHHRTRSKDGQYVHIEEMILAFRRMGHEVVIVAPPSAETESFGSDAGFVAWLKRYLPRFFYELMELAYSFVAYRRLAKAVREHRPDCLYERYNLLLPAGVWLKKRFRLPMLLEVNSPLFEEREKHDGLALKRLARWSQSYAWKHADFVLPVTQVLADIVAAYGVDRSKIVVIPNGINDDRFADAPDTLAAKQALGLQNHLVLGFTGFVRDWHGLDRIVTMIANDPPQSPRHLLVVGDGPVRAKLERQAQELNISDRVTFTGIIGRDEVARYVATFDVALQPAVVAYASPLKLFEYLALGKAIIGPDQPNIKEILDDGENALLFAPDSHDSMTAAIDRLSRDENLRRALGENARLTIRTMRLTWDANAEKVTKLFDLLITRN